MPRAATRQHSDVLVFLTLVAVSAILVAAAWGVRGFRGGEPTRGGLEPIEIVAETVHRGPRLTILELTSTHSAFGGLSAVEVHPAADRRSLDGIRLLAVTDRGRWLSFRPRLDADGRIVSLDEVLLGTLRDLDGRPVSGRTRRDAEETTPWGDGLLVAFEGDHRLVAFEGPEPLDDPEPRRLRAPEATATLDLNDGIEAMTALGDGRVLLIAEGPRDDRELLALASDAAAVDPDAAADGSSLRAWVGDPESGRWDFLRIAATGPLQATAAALLPWGEVLLLERHYEPSTGRVTARLSALDVAAIAPGARVVSREILRFPEDVPVDNFEGLTVVPTADGGAVALLLADDNFADDQRTLMAQLHVSMP